MCNIEISRSTAIGRIDLGLLSIIITQVIKPLCKSCGMHLFTEKGVCAFNYLIAGAIASSFPFSILVVSISN